MIINKSNNFYAETFYEDSKNISELYRYLKICRECQFPMLSSYVIAACYHNIENNIISYPCPFLLKAALQSPIIPEEATKAFNFGVIFVFPEIAQYLIDKGAVLTEKHFVFIDRLGNNFIGYKDRRIMEFFESKKRELENDNI